MYTAMNPSYSILHLERRSCRQQRSTLRHKIASPAVQQKQVQIFSKELSRLDTVLIKGKWRKWLNLSTFKISQDLQLHNCMLLSWMDGMTENVELKSLTNLEELWRINRVRLYWQVSFRTLWRKWDLTVVGESLP